MAHGDGKFVQVSPAFFANLDATVARKDNTGTGLDIVHANRNINFQGSK